MVKRYLARVHGLFPADGKQSQITAPLDGKPAQTSYTVLSEDPSDRTSLLDIEIHTGRFHQIRRHLSGIGHPLVGDRKYNPGGGSSGFFLQAYELSFTSPFSGRNVRYRLPE